ncbi:helix-turn-helix transcriptional regulator [Anaerosacchariphilus polymeriproducens]|uniref:YafY family transcriptional regulator n=1 Tax=Anaerosacchariphilus polymeriproducens TaxID=1812858 RepID=A0A371ATX6_9FIRM|nr:YafY family protein [Anaerosacchariphilus polymeriproducens]RDU23017.1 YafY family transcriptional regulator [Anaerosacchariphilus polymeriproducens]
MKIDRLVGIVFILLQKGKVTAPYLAEKYEVSRRTINRDIEDLCKAGIPIITTQGIHGGISISDDYKIDKTLLTSKEMQAILAGIKSLDSISNSSMYRKLMEKLSHDIEYKKESIYDSSGHILIDLSSHYKSTIAPKIESLRNAIDQNQMVAFNYYYEKGENKRVIEPYLLIFQWANWYVWGYCIKRKDFRLFKLNRILQLHILEEFFFARPIKSYEKQIEQYFRNEIHFIAKFDADVKWRLIDEYGIDSFQELEDNTLIFEYDFSNREYLLRWILSFGKHVEILEPADFKKEYQEQVLQMQNKCMKYDS